MKAELLHTGSFWCSPGVRWVREADHILVLNRNTGHTLKLEGASAAIWDWMTLGYRFGQVAAMLAVFLDQPQAVAERRVRESLQTWTVTGFILTPSGEPHGKSGD